MAKAALTPEQTEIRDLTKANAQQAKEIDKLEAKLAKAEAKVAELATEKAALFTAKQIAKATQDGAKRMRELILAALPEADTGTTTIKGVVKTIKGVKYPGAE